MSSLSETPKKDVAGKLLAVCALAVLEVSMPGDLVGEGTQKGLLQSLHVVVACFLACLMEKQLILGCKPLSHW